MDGLFMLILSQGSAALYKFGLLRFRISSSYHCCTQGGAGAGAVFRGVDRWAWSNGCAETGIFWAMALPSFSSVADQLLSWRNLKYRQKYAELNFPLSVHIHTEFLRTNLRKHCLISLRLILVVVRLSIGYAIWGLYYISLCSVRPYNIILTKPSFHYLFFYLAQLLINF